MNTGLSLVEIFRAQGDATDKLTAHQYPYIYDIVFDGVEWQPVRLLEIGIGQGGSIRAWHEFFYHDDTIIYALDIERQLVANLYNLSDRVRASQIDVANKDELASWLIDKEFDIVIDDGSHKLYDIMNAFDLIWPKVVEGGCYIIEDVAQAEKSGRVIQKFFQIAEDILFNQNNAISLTVWPNLILIEKKQKDDPRCPEMGTL